MRTKCANFWATLYKRTHCLSSVLGWNCCKNWPKIPTDYGNNDKTWQGFDFFGHAVYRCKLS